MSREQSATEKDVLPRHLMVTAHAWYGDTIGGSFRLASELAKFAAARGHDVTYVCCRTVPDGPLDEVADGVRIRRYAPAVGRLTGWRRLRHHVRETSRLVRNVATERPVDALSGHSPLQFLGAARAVTAPGAIKTFVVHSPFDDELASNAMENSLSHRLAIVAARWVDARNVRLADRVQTVSQYTLDVMMQKHGRAVQRKGIVAPGWVDCDRFRPAVDRRALRRSLGLDWDTPMPLFFTLRRLEARMGLETLIAAASQLFQQGLKFRVLIGGSGSLRVPLEAAIRAAGLQDVVRMLGRVAEEDLPACYAAADCFVLPTRALECFGLIVLEAFACNTPVIASRVAAIPELAGMQGESWMFEPGNAEALAMCMTKFISNKLLLQQDLLSVAAKYDRQSVQQRWLDLAVSDAGAQQGSVGGEIDRASGGPVVRVAASFRSP